jgi:hypothetical protein
MIKLFHQVLFPYVNACTGRLQTRKELVLACKSVLRTVKLSADSSSFTGPGNRKMTWRSQQSHHYLVPHLLSSHRFAPSTLYSRSHLMPPSHIAQILYPTNTLSVCPSPAITTASMLVYPILFIKLSILRCCISH